MVFNPPELSLNFRNTYVPRTITEFMTQLSSIANSSERLLKLDEFVKRLEDEMRKIDVFKRELPLATLLINDVIITLREESVHIRKSNIEPILEEFIPLNKSSDISEKLHDDSEKETDARDKRNWLSSVQLWNGHDSTKSNSPIETNKVVEMEDHPVTVDKNGFTPFKGYSSFSVVVAGKEDNQVVPAEGLSLVTPGIKNSEEELNFGVLSYKTSCSKAISSSSMEERSNLRNGSQASQTSRKQRRCWSPELHRRFVNALQQLGGSQVATPKQIRELMQVDGLTNDEVKSHLQKYRLHTRKVPNTNGDTSDQSALVLWSHNKQNESSPVGPSSGSSNTSMEDDEDEKSESHSWKNHIHAT